MNNFRPCLLPLILSTVLCLLGARPAQAGSATWQLDPTNGDWTFPANWMPDTVPNDPADTATFAISNQRAVSVRGEIEVDKIRFEPGASVFTLDAVGNGRMTLSGDGIANNSGSVQSFRTVGEVEGDYPSIRFLNSATAGTDLEITNTATGSGPQTGFFDDSNAGEAVIVNEGATGRNGGAGLVDFNDNASAANSTIMNFGAGLTFGSPGVCIFDGNSTAGNSTIINLPGVGGGINQTDFRASANAGNATILTFGSDSRAGTGSQTTFHVNSAANAIMINDGGTAPNAGGGTTIFFGGTAENGTLIANPGTDGGLGGRISFFYKSSSGGTARAQLFGNGTLDFTGREGPSLTIGSIEGDGIVLLGSNTLKVGGNGLSTEFSGVVKGDGALVKTGPGTLTLSGANTYVGGTKVRQGILILDSKVGFATGTGSVAVDSKGILTGRGDIAGALTVGLGTGGRPGLRPGIKGIGRLNVQGDLTMGVNGVYFWSPSPSAMQPGEIAALGVTIENGAIFSASIHPDLALPLGAVFTAIRNTATTSIAGEFANLPDGSTLTVGLNKFLVDYGGGDGNDLTLTVVP
ncbi:MAG: autotransporter-associated beta strand repeat-containing protein [Chthoniobacterales bacterium]